MCVCVRVCAFVCTVIFLTIYRYRDESSGESCSRAIGTHDPAHASVSVTERGVRGDFKNRSPLTSAYQSIFKTNDNNAQDAARKCNVRVPVHTKTLMCNNSTKYKFE